MSEREMTLAFWARCRERFGNSWTYEQGIALQREERGAAIQRSAQLLSGLLAAEELGLFAGPPTRADMAILTGADQVGVLAT